MSNKLLIGTIITVLVSVGGAWYYYDIQQKENILKEKQEKERLERIEQERIADENEKKEEQERLVQLEDQKKKELEYISNFKDRNKNKISVIDITKNKNIVLSDNLAKKIININKGIITVDEITKKNDLVIYIQSNLKKSPKQEEIKKIIEQVNKKYTNGKFTIVDDESGNIVYYMYNDKVGVKSDKLIQAEEIMSTETVAVTDEEKNDLINKPYNIIYEEHYNKNNLIIYIAKDLDIEQDVVKNTIKRFQEKTENAKIYIYKDQNGDIQIIIRNYKKGISSNTNSDITKKQLTKVRKSTHVYYFDFDKTNVINKDYLNNYLENLEIAIEELEVKTLIIVGHTDSLGPKSYNKLLSYKRTHSLNKYFNKLDINLEYRAKGESEPVATNDTTEGRAKNRRIELFYGWSE
ncbi:MAG: OmpA family protein [Campylobacterota bacterium]|nr:OmpA family protein [Campylobacterota bacterium]